MKTKRTLIAVMILSMALLTACSTKESADNSATSLDDLYQQENQVFADHEDVWNKVFGMMDKTTADPNGNYADYLADTIESGKEAFTDDELKTLTDDMETIRNLEEQIAEMENENAASDTTGQENNAENVSPFKNFSGLDFDGNPGLITVKCDSNYVIRYNGSYVNEIRIGHYPRRLKLVARKTYQLLSQRCEWWIDNAAEFKISSDGTFAGTFRSI